MSKELFYQKQIMNPYSTESQSHTAYEKGFVEGWKKCQENDDVELANIRNKLGALKNLIQMIERGYIVPDDKLKEIIEQSIPVCKESIEYLANGKFKIK
jgi:hypothetical protein